MWPIKEKENRQLLMAKSYPYSKLQEYDVTVLLLTSTLLVNTLGEDKHFLTALQCLPLPL